MSPVLILCLVAALAGCGAAPTNETGAAGMTGACREFNASYVNTYNYSMRGADWSSNKAWQCGGAKQSPIDYAAPAEYKYANVSAPVALSNPSVTEAAVLNLPQWEVELLGNFSSNGLAVPICNGTDVGCLKSPGATPKYVNATIANLHFHTPSEHTLDGKYFALESHLVTRVSQKDVPTCPAKGCIAVWGAFYRISQKNSTFLDQLLPYLNMSGAGCTALPLDKTINLVEAFPTNRTYVTYPGSLTTPPCTEGVLWTSFLTPLRMSSKQLAVISDAMNNVRSCTTTAQGSVCAMSGFQSDSRMLQDLNGRQLHLPVHAHAGGAHRALASPAVPSRPASVDCGGWHAGNV